MSSLWGQGQGEMGAGRRAVVGSEEKRYRFKCVDRMHYRTKWHESYQAALMEMIKTFEKGENA